MSGGAHAPGCNCDYCLSDLLRRPERAGGGNAELCECGGARFVQWEANGTPFHCRECNTPQTVSLVEVIRGEQAAVARLREFLIEMLEEPERYSERTPEEARSEVDRVIERARAAGMERTRG